MLLLGIYRGFGSTILREIPFSFIQFPLWEYFKVLYVEMSGNPLNPLKVSLCGALAGMYVFDIPYKKN